MLLTLSAVGDGKRGALGTTLQERGKPLLDFGALPPEINSGRIYSGPGSVPLLAAATPWYALATEWHSTRASYASTITELTNSGWHGPYSVAAADAAAPYTASL